jgi:hypothetical protein
MEMDKDAEHSAIASAITAELQRQAEAGAQRIDVDALTDAVQRSLSQVHHISEGRHPQELNSSNDG